MKSPSLEAARARLRRWRGAVLGFELRVAPSENQRLFVLTLFIGAACGLAAVAFHLSIRYLAAVGVERVVTEAWPHWAVWLIVLPTGGATLAGLLLEYVVPAARGSGIPQVKVAYASSEGRVRLRDSVGKFLIGVLQIGSGASLGREGPTVQICAGIASASGRLAGISRQGLRRLLPVGAAAGIAAAFNAPIAAVTFTIEEVVGTLDQTVLSGVVIAAALAAVIERAILGQSPVFDVPAGYGLHDPRSLVLYAFLGFAAAAVSVAFTDLLLAIRKKSRASPVPAWLRPAAGGLVTGVLAVVVVRAFGAGAEGVTGGGYRVLGQALGGKLPVITMAVLVVAKLIATAAAYGTGGAGGIFAPALFMGGMLGGVVGTLDNAVLGSTPQNLGAFALVGMGAVFAGVIRAPITSVLIIIEMTDGYGLILPLMIANMTSYVLAARMRPTPIYEALLEQDGISLRRHRLIDGLEHLRCIPALLRTTGNAFDQRTPGAEILRRAGDLSRKALYPVVDDDKKVVGVITTDALTALVSEPDLHPYIVASDVMQGPLSVKHDDNLAVAFELMRLNGLPQLPVVDGDGRLLGLIDEADIAHEYLRRQVAHEHKPSGAAGGTAP